MSKEERTDISIKNIKLAFLGASKNLYLLKNIFMKIENIPIYQYSNYLSLFALCIEIGLKSIIINTDDFECIHFLDKLFLETPETFQNKLKSLFLDEEYFNRNMSNMSKMFVDFRYMKYDSTLKEYLDVSIINSDKTINFRKAISLQNVKFLQVFLDNIIEYDKIIREKTLIEMVNIDFSNEDCVIKQYSDLLKDMCINKEEI